MNDFNSALSILMNNKYNIISDCITISDDNVKLVTKSLIKNVKYSSVKIMSDYLPSSQYCLESIFNSFNNGIFSVEILLTDDNVFNNPNSCLYGKEKFMSQFNQTILIRKMNNVTKVNPFLVIDERDFILMTNTHNVLSINDFEQGEKMSESFDSIFNVAVDYKELV